MVGATTSPLISFEPFAHRMSISGTPAKCPTCKSSIPLPEVIETVAEQKMWTHEIQQISARMNTAAKPPYIETCDIEAWNPKTETFCSVSGQDRYHNRKPKLNMALDTWAKASSISYKKIKDLRLEEYIYAGASSNVSRESTVRNSRLERWLRSAFGQRLFLRSTSGDLATMVAYDGRECPVVGYLKIRFKPDGTTAWQEADLNVVRTKKDVDIDFLLGPDCNCFEDFLDHHRAQFRANAANSPEEKAAFHEQLQCANNRLSEGGVPG